MESFRSHPLRYWKLETTYNGAGDRYHRRSTGDGETWRPTKPLGSGSFGDVWQERCTAGPSQNAVRAVKQLHKRHTKFLEMSQREIEALITFSAAEYRRHFVQFLGWFDDTDHLYLAMEFIEYGDLQRFITAPFPESEAVSIVTQIAQALRYMHQKSFVHRDVKPLNILVCSPRPNWHVKLADFGIAKKTDGTALGTHCIGSSGYMAPELYDTLSPQYTAAVDIWSLGAVAFCLRTCSPPFRTIKHLLDYTRDHRVQFPIRPLGTSSGFCMNFILGAMEDLPERRFTIEHVLAHEWLTQSPVEVEGVDNSTANFTSSTVWSIPPSNAWSNTYESAETQRPQHVSLATPIAPSPPLPQPGEQPADGGLATKLEDLDLNANGQGDYKSLNAVGNIPCNGEDRIKIKNLADLTMAYCKERNYELAGLLAYELVDLTHKTFGSKHLETINALATLAATYREQHKYSYSEPLDRKLLTIRRQVLGDKHPDTIQIMDIITKTYTTQYEPHDNEAEPENYESKQEPEQGVYAPQTQPHGSLLDLQQPDPISTPNVSETGNIQSRITDKPAATGPNLRLTIISANKLYRRDIFSLPDPIAVASVNGKRMHATSIIHKSLNPHWNEKFDIVVSTNTILTIQIFDQRKFKRDQLKAQQDQGRFSFSNGEHSLLGLATIQVGDIIELTAGNDKTITRALELRHHSDDTRVHGTITLNLSTNLPFQPHTPEHRSKAPSEVFDLTWTDTKSEPVCWEAKD
ncbi:kinase-like domain-containing protein [Aspergillus californicus]